MSEKQTVSSSSTKGKGSAIADPATHTTAIAGVTIVAQNNEEEDVFALASQIEEILHGKSYKTCMKVMTMVGSLHGIRAIPIDRPIGQSTVGTTKVVPTPKKPKKGQPTPPAAWKQTDVYRRLSAEREMVVKTIKSLSPAELSKTTHVEVLRSLERQLKDLKSPTVGDH